MDGFGSFVGFEYSGRSVIGSGYEPSSSVLLLHASRLVVGADADADTDGDAGCVRGVLVSWYGFRRVHLLCINVRMGSLAQ